MEPTVGLKDLPAIICGPMVRRLAKEDMVIWLVTTSACELTLKVWLADENLGIDIDIGTDVDTDKPAYQQISSSNNANCHCIQIGHSAFIRILHFTFDNPISDLTSLEYDVLLGEPSKQEGLKTHLPDLLLGDELRPKLIYKNRIDSMLHGSCRKPHHASRDSLIRIEQHLKSESLEQRPALLMMAGDQIYADDVSGPLLVAIHQVIELLGLNTEELQGALVTDSETLFKHESCYYDRVHLLPDDDANEAVQKSFYKGKRKPIFTSVNAQNHLITAAEIYAMYLLSWSPVLWQYVDLDKHNIPPQFVNIYNEEKPHIEEFRDDLIAVQRVFSHLPVYMIFDDHDVTDDWNLTRGWEQAAYGNPFSKRIIGNALLGYWLFQGLGNAPQQFDSLLHQQHQYFTSDGMKNQDKLIGILLDWPQWHYVLHTEPKIVVLDTRTHRWRSEESVNQPSGLMDWESLTHLQEELYDQNHVIIVSAAPIFGVKIIESIQRIFTFFGKALMVDAENWMAHKGTAKVILETFLDSRTPDYLTILSGDVHYSFVYDVRLRSFKRKQHTHIVQVTCSGIKNSFPDKLLRIMDKLNRWIYGRWSLFNFFTKRRKLSILPRHPNRKAGTNINTGDITNTDTQLGLRSTDTLVNASAISKISFDTTSNEVNVTLHCYDGRDVDFK